MLTLFLLRHAKAAPLGSDGDFARPLLPKGRHDATRLGGYLARRDLRPSKAIVSAAKRTRETFDLLNEAMGDSVAVGYEDALFTDTATQIRNRLKAIPRAVPSLMIVGHNPSIQEATITLSRDGDVMDLQRIRSTFPPCSLAILSFDTDDWEDARVSGGRLDLFLVPDDLVALD